jgi:hypothetical protein
MPHAEPYNAAAINVRALLRWIMRILLHDIIFETNG